jgi:hypothetical protein
LKTAITIKLVYFEIWLIKIRGIYNGKKITIVTAVDKDSFEIAKGKFLSNMLKKIMKVNFNDKHVPL